MDDQTRYQLIHELAEDSAAHNRIDPKLYERYSVKRGLRNDDGTGVLVGLTEVGEVFSYVMDDADRIPVEGRLYYRGIAISDLVNGFYHQKRFGFEETTYLLLFGELPTERQLAQFNELLLQGNNSIASVTLLHGPAFYRRQGGHIHTCIARVAHTLLI